VFASIAVNVEQVTAAAEPILGRAGFRFTGGAVAARHGRPLPFGDKQWIYSSAGKAE
jgi:hypothetical protein